MSTNEQELKDKLFNAADIPRALKEIEEDLNGNNVYLAKEKINLLNRILNDTNIPIGLQYATKSSIFNITDLFNLRVSTSGHFAKLRAESTGQTASLLAAIKSLIYEATNQAVEYHFRSNGIDNTNDKATLLSAEKLTRLHLQLFYIYLKDNNLGNPTFNLPIVQIGEIFQKLNKREKLFIIEERGEFFIFELEVGGWNGDKFSVKVSNATNTLQYTAELKEKDLKVSKKLNYPFTALELLKLTAENLHKKVQKDFNNLSKAASDNDAVFNLVYRRETSDRIKSLSNLNNILLSALTKEEKTEKKETEDASTTS